MHWPGTRGRWSIGRYLDRELWTADPSAHGVAGRVAIHVLRLAVVIVRAPLDSQLNLEATALVYRTLLSMVPLLAVAFSVLKAFGAQYRIEPVLIQVLAPLGAAGVEIAARIVEFVTNLRVSVLGAVGLLGLFYTVISVIEKIEDALNRIWHARRSRSLVRKFSDYLSILLVGPVLVFAAFGLMASARSQRLVQRVLAKTPLEPETVALAWHAVPFLLLVVAFTLLYRFLPYARVAPRAALMGGVTAALLWEGAGVAFAALVAGSSSYAAIYSSFAVLVVFLLWLQVAWLVVLVGGQVAFVHQHPTAYVALRGRPSALLRERVALAALVEITRRHLGEAPPARVDDLSRTLGAPLPIVDALVEDFVARGFLARAVEPDGVVLARPPEQVRVAEVLDVVREPAPGAAIDVAVTHEAVLGALRRRDDAVSHALGDLTLRSLASPPASPDATVTNLSAYRQR
jgi:membrane protein